MQNFHEQLDTVQKHGFFKIWVVDPATGEKDLVVNKDNMILNMGSDLLASALAGVKYAAISHMYIGYCNYADGTFTRPTIDKTYSTPFTGYGSGAYANFGYLRLPLAYSPSFLAQSGYAGNVALFTTIIATADFSHGASFISSEYATANSVNPSQIFEVALIAALDPQSEGQDKIFSRANFNPLLYSSSYNLTTTWGIQFLS